MFQDYQPHILGIRPQNMTQTSNSLLSPLNQWLLWVTNGNQGQMMMHFQCSETINQS